MDNMDLEEKSILVLSNNSRNNKKSLKVWIILSVEDFVTGPFLMSINF